MKEGWKETDPSTSYPCARCEPVPRASHGAGWERASRAGERCTKVFVWEELRGGHEEAEEMMCEESSVKAAAKEEMEPGCFSPTAFRAFCHQETL